MADHGQSVDPQLLNAARHAAADAGWASATLAKVAAAAGVSRMTLHRRGVTREAILDGFAAEMSAAYREAFWPALVSRADAAERLSMALVAQCRVEEKYVDVSAAVAEREQNAVFHETGPEALTRDEFTAPLVRILLDGQVESVFRVRDVAETATLLFNLVAWTYRHLRTGHEWSPQHAAAAVVEVAVRGVRA